MVTLIKSYTSHMGNREAGHYSQGKIYWPY
uniref:Uncharacterized protein n=1 Tax=Anguilla anguilla TaxID=7936 RepID=A0A0E9VHM5_ANGAN